MMVRGEDEERRGEARVGLYTGRWRAVTASRLRGERARDQIVSRARCQAFLSQGAFMTGRAGKDDPLTPQRLAATGARHHFPRFLQ